MHLAVGILRIEDGFDISSEIEDQGQVALRKVYEHHHKKHAEVPKLLQNDNKGKPDRCLKNAQKLQRIAQ